MLMILGQCWGLSVSFYNIYNIEFVNGIGYFLLAYPCIIMLFTSDFQMATLILPTQIIETLEWEVVQFISTIFAAMAKSTDWWSVQVKPTPGNTTAIGAFLARMV